MTTTTSAAGGGKWFDKLAVPRSTPASMDVAMLHELLVTQSKTNSTVKVLIVDVRRADMEGDQAYMIPHAINLPAQSFYQTLPALVPILSHSNGRGPRCAAWYEDALIAQGIKSNARVLTGGIKAWIAHYPDEVIDM